MKKKGKGDEVEMGGLISEGKGEMHGGVCGGGGGGVCFLLGLAMFPIM